MSINLGRLEKVELRDFFKDEGGVLEVVETEWENSQFSPPR